MTIVIEKQDRIPTWDRNPATWKRFESQAEWHAETFKVDDIKLAAPRLINQMISSSDSVLRAFATALKAKDFNVKVSEQVLNTVQ